MKINQLSFALGNIFGAAVVGVVVVACGGGGGATSTALLPLSSYSSIPASNILLSDSATTAAKGSNIVRTSLFSPSFPSDQYILASQVQIQNAANASNALLSQTLQAALDSELAVDTTKNIQGTWTIENITSDSTYTGTWATGRVIFKSDGTYSITAGGFGAAGKVAAGTGSFCSIPTSQTYRLIDGAIYFGADSGGDSVAVVAKNTSTSMTLIGDGGCGAQGIARISKLTKISTATAGLSVEPKAALAVLPSSKSKQPALIRTSY